MKELEIGIFIPKGSLVDKYSIEEKLATGGFGTVHSAKELPTGKSVAVKFGSPTNKEMFAEEAKIHQTVHELNNPHILPYKGEGVIRSKGGEDFELPYIVTERAYMSLKDELGMNGPLPLAHASDMVTQVADALTAIHEEGYVHADVKPANILIAEGETILLGDFGLASRSPRLEKSDILITPAYSAPEQWGGLTIPKSDAYNLGLVLFEGATGKTFWDKPSEEQGKIVTYEKDHEEFKEGKIGTIDPAFQAPLRQVLHWDFDKRPTVWEFSWDVAMRVLDVTDDSRKHSPAKTIFDLHTVPLPTQYTEGIQTVFYPSHGDLDMEI